MKHDSPIFSDIFIPFTTIQVTCQIKLTLIYINTGQLRHRLGSPKSGLHGHRTPKHSESYILNRNQCAWPVRPLVVGIRLKWNRVHESSSVEKQSLMAWEASFMPAVSSAPRVTRTRVRQRARWTRASELAIRLWPFSHLQLNDLWVIEFASGSNMLFELRALKGVDFALWISLNAGQLTFK